MMTVAGGQVVEPDGDVPGAWLPIPTAAHALGVGERTIRRRIERGQLARRAHQDGHVEVRVPRAGTPGPSVAEADGDGQERALALAERYTELVAAQTAPLVARVEELARENGQLAERVRQLEAERDAARHVSANMADRPAPRWRRWWVALVGAGLAVAVGASCGQAGSIKHPAMCSVARQSLDYWASFAARRQVESQAPGVGTRGELWAVV